MAHPASPDRAGLITRAAAVVAGAVGGLVLLGWLLDAPALQALHPAAVPMNPLSAVAFLVAGAGLWLLRAEGGRFRRLGQACGAVVALVGVLKLADYGLGWDVGFDRLLFRGSLGRNEIAPNTALNFALLGLALALLDVEVRGHRPAQVLAILTGLGALMALVGYAYDVRPLYGVAAHIPMALNTALALAALSLGALTARPDRGLVRVFSSPGPGGLLARRLLPCAVVLPLLLGWLRLIGQRAGYYETEVGVALYTTANIAVFALMVLLTGVVLERLDADRKRAAEELHRERHFLHSLMEHLPDSIYFKDPEGRFLRVSRGLATRLGVRDPAAVVGKTDFHFFTEEHARPASEDEQRVLRTGQPVFGKVEKETWADGRERWVLTTRLPLRDPDGQIVGTFGLSRDITEQKTAEKVLAASEQRYRSLIQATAAIVWDTPASGEFEAEQPGWSAFTGQPFDELKGWGWLNAVHPDDRPHTTAVWRHAVEHRVLYQVEHRLRRHDGQYRHMSVRAVPILGPDGAIREWIGVHHDLTEIRRAEEALRETEAQLRLLLESTGEGVYGIDTHGNCTFINPAAAEMIGAPVADVLGQNMHALIHHRRPDGSPYPVEECPIFQAFRTGRGCQVERDVFWRQDGTSFPVEYSAYPIRTRGQQIQGAVVTFKDNSERDQMRALLVQSEKLASIGLLSAGIAHEINNPLSYVGNNLVVLQRDLKGVLDILAEYERACDRLATVDPTTAERVRSMAAELDLDYVRDNLDRVLTRTRDGVQRVTNIVQSLRSLARTDRPQLEDASLPDLVDMALEMIRGRLKRRGVAIETDYGPVTRVRCVPTQLGQVFLNLLTNAMHAIEKSDRPEGAGRIRVAARPVAGGVALTVEDNGCGIDPDHLPQLFDPFFTTKPVGEGTGLGLAITHGIVTGHGGRIEVDSKVDVGTRFRIFLPANPDPAAAAPPVV